MSPPRPVTRYDHSLLAGDFSRRLSGSEGDVSVLITSSRLADLDQDGSQDDAFGTGILQNGRRFQSFIFLRREDGATRFLDSSGTALNPASGLRSLFCTESRPWLCPATLERARRQLDTPRISMLDYDSSRLGLELIIRQDGGRFVWLNALEIFADGRR